MESSIDLVFQEILNTEKTLNEQTQRLEAVTREAREARSYYDEIKTQNLRAATEAEYNGKKRSDLFTEYNYACLELEALNARAKELHEEKGKIKRRVDQLSRELSEAGAEALGEGALPRERAGMDLVTLHAEYQRSRSSMLVAMKAEEEELRERLSVCLAAERVQCDAGEKLRTVLQRLNTEAEAAAGKRAALEAEIARLEQQAKRGAPRDPAVLRLQGHVEQARGQISKARAHVQALEREVEEARMLQEAMQSNPYMFEDSNF
eukprot:Colp12_sorted_trinity150504_noHs@4124